MGLLRKVGFAILLRSLACSGEELECGNVLNEGGHFNYPSTCWQSFASGVPINITWETTFAQINLFYTRVVNTGDAWPLAYNAAPNGPPTEEGLYTGHFLWKTFPDGSDLPPNRSIPMYLHIVDAQGSVVDQFTGGFYTNYFYIRQSEPSATTLTTSSITLAPTSSSSLVAQTRSSTPTTIEGATASRRVPSAVSSIRSSLLPSSTAGPRLTDATGIDSPIVKVALGLGIGIGGPLIIVGIVLISLYCLRTQKACNPRESKLMASPLDIRSLILRPGLPP